MVTVSLNCTYDSQIQRQMQVNGRCRRLPPGTNALSQLLFHDGRFRLLGTPSMRQDSDFRRATRGAAKRGRAPMTAGPAQPLPYLTIQYVLGDLGYLANGRSGRRLTTTKAIKAYQADHGWPSPACPSLSLMGALLSSTEKARRQDQRRPQRQPLIQQRLDARPESANVMGQGDLAGPDPSGSPQRPSAAGFGCLPAAARFDRGPRFGVARL